MPIQYTLVSNGDEKNITVFIPGEAMPLVRHSSQPNFEAIVSLVVGGEDDAYILKDLFDTSVAVAERFENLSERVTVSNGRLYFDDDEVDDALTKQVLRFLTEGVDDWKPLVAFFEKVQANPSQHSRTQLFEWLNRHEFTIADNGDLIGYKGVMKDENSKLVSVHAGPAVVDGEAVNGHVPNYVGALVTIARSSVDDDSARGCSSGLHVGTYAYAESYSRNGAMLEVHVNPRDVVSVPTDCDAQKVRVCRYRVARIINEQYAQPLLPDEPIEDDNWYWDDEDYDQD